MTTETPLVSVVIPAYNRRESLMQLLADVYRQEGVSYEVIVVDDCSPDDTSVAVTTQFPQVRLFRNAVNGGPAVSRNRGVREAKGEYIVGFDSDVTTPDRLVLQRVVETFRQFPKATGLAFRLLSPDGKTDDAPRWWHPVPIAKFADQRFETHYFSGTGYAFRRDAMMAAGLFPEILYMHYEEVELAFRILDAGGTILHCPDIPVLHHAHPVSNRSKIRIFYKPRNQILLAVRCYSLPRAILYVAPRFTYGLLSALVHFHLGSFFQAMRSALQLSSTCMHERKPLKVATWNRISALGKAGTLAAS